MKRYSIRPVQPRAMIDAMELNREHFIGATTVYEADASQPTGILDPRGNMIFTSEFVGPIGFNR